MIEVYFEGQVARVYNYNPEDGTGGFRDEAGALMDPTTVRVKAIKPDGTTVTYTHPTAEITKDAVGKYRADLDTTGLPGKWFFRWQGEGSGQAAAEHEFRVIASAQP